MYAHRIIQNKVEFPGGFCQQFLLSLGTNFLEGKGRQGKGRQGKGKKWLLDKR